jgi:hypothetical protein
MKIQSHKSRFIEHEAERAVDKAGCLNAFFREAREL